MYSSSTRRVRGRPRGERSPFSSPYTALLSTPIAARRGSLEERRRPAANFNADVSPTPEIKIDEEEDEGGPEPEEEDEELDEDGEGDASPLLPIFSAAHLGMSFFHHINLSPLTFANTLFNRYRCSPCLQPDPYSSPAGSSTMRNHTLLGPTEVSPSLTVSCEAHSAANSNVPFFTSDIVCLAGKLPTVQQGGPYEPGKQWRK